MVNSNKAEDYKILSFEVNENVLPKENNIIKLKPNEKTIEDEKEKVKIKEKVNNYNIVKRVLDVILAVIMLVVLSPLMLITSLAIKINSKGPIFFKQKRIGKNGEEFDIYKFRSMCVNNNPSDLSVPDKYTSIGKFIRKTSIDELPQLINIIKGDMTFIGPRPWTPMYYENMTEEQRHRYDVLPGITGLAQVNGRNCASVIDRINYDLEYVNNYSLKSDIDIVFKTFSVLFCKDGADGGKGTVLNDMELLKNQNTTNDIEIMKDKIEFMQK